MFSRLRRRKYRVHEIEPDEIFLDSTNLPEYNSKQFEGRGSRPVSLLAILTGGVVFSLVAVGFGYRPVTLQIAEGEPYSGLSRANPPDRSVLFGTRGLVY